MSLQISLLCFSPCKGSARKDECFSITKKYKADKPFATCVNLYAGHDLYFTQSCPIPGPRLCIEPIPEGVNFHMTNKKRQHRTDETLLSPDDSIIPFANMTRIKGRLTATSKDDLKLPMDCLWCWNYTYQSAMWSKYVNTIEKTVGFTFSNSPVRTLLEFGCGSGGFLGEMAVRGVNGICTAKEIPNGDGSESYLPYLRTVAARGLLAMHLSVMSHQPFLSNSFDFIHCSWVLAYVTPTHRWVGINIRVHSPLSFVHTAMLISYQLFVCVVSTRMYSQIFIEWDRLLTPGGLVVQQVTHYTTILVDPPSLIYLSTIY